MNYISIVLKFTGIKGIIKQNFVNVLYDNSLEMPLKINVIFFILNKWFHCLTQLLIGNKCK